MTAHDTSSLRGLLKRCPPDCIEAAVRFSETGDVDRIPVIVAGIAERFIEPMHRPLLRSGDDGLRIIEDLGVDSLTLFEIVRLMEEVFLISISNQALRGLRTIGDVRMFITQQVQTHPRHGKSVVERPARPECVSTSAVKRAT